MILTTLRMIDFNSLDLLFNNRAGKSKTAAVTWQVTIPTFWKNPAKIFNRAMDEQPYLPRKIRKLPKMNRLSCWH